MNFPILIGLILFWVFCAFWVHQRIVSNRLQHRLLTTPDSSMGVNSYVKHGLVHVEHYAQNTHFKKFYDTWHVSSVHVENGDF